MRTRGKARQPRLTRAIAYAAGRDAGNRHMRAAGRSRWNASDFEAAADEFERLCPAPTMEVRHARPA